MQQRNHAKPDAVIVPLARSVWVVKRASRSRTAWLAQHDNTPTAQHERGSFERVLHPLVQLFPWWSVATHALVQEKFLTIRLALCGRGSLGLRVNEVLILSLKQLFERLQVPFAQLAERTGRRHSFISYNFVFRRLFDLLGCSHLGADFPPLKSKKKREDIISIWLGLITYLQWPYLNSDAQLFGSGHAVDLAALYHRRGPAPQPARKRAKTSAHAQHGSDRFRRTCASGASECSARGQDHAVVPDVCAALCGTDDCGTRGLDNGGLVWVGDFLI